MEQQNFLGIYLGRNRATAVVVNVIQHKPTILTSFSITRAASDQPSSDDTETTGSSNPLAAQIIGDLNARNITFTEAFVALDCSLFAQHKLHSEFTDPKQIAQTIKFDVEEAVATDAAELAVAFQLTSTDQNGSDIATFTAERQLLDEMLADLQQNNIDPITIEPDIICLIRFLLQYSSHTDHANPLYVVISGDCCYLVTPSPDHHSRIARSFLVTGSQDKTSLLSSQIPITIASSIDISDQGPIDSLIIACDSGDIDGDTIAENTGLTVEQIDLTQIAAVDPNVIVDCNSNANFAIATGAALAEVSKNLRTDFREDFSPYQGKKIIIQKTLRLVAISVTVLMLAVALFFQLKAFRKTKYTAQLKQKTANDYSAVMFGEKHLKKSGPIASALKRRRVELENKGAGASFGDDESVPAKLTYVLDAFNSVPTNVKLNINDISVNTKNIRITGNTNSRSGTTKLFNAIKTHKQLKLASESMKDAGRSFTINVKSK